MSPPSARPFMTTSMVGSAQDTLQALVRKVDALAQMVHIRKRLQLLSGIVTDRHAPPFLIHRARESQPRSLCPRAPNRL